MVASIQPTFSDHKKFNQRPIGTLFEAGPIFQVPVRIKGSKGQTANLLELYRHDDTILDGVSLLTVSSAGDMSPRILNSTYYNVKVFGAKGDGTTDDTTAIQAAIDAAQTQVTASADAPIVWFPPGRYVLTSTITAKSAHLVGAFPNNSVRIFWNGAAGATVITNDGTFAGGTAFWMMSGINFRDGTNEPATWLDITAATADKFFTMNRMHFGACSGDAIKFLAWINLHLEHIRWDNIGGYAIRLTPGVQNLSSFILDKFTYDHGRASGPASGFMLIDNTQNNSNLGVFEVSNARMEIGTAWTGAQAVISFTSDTIFTGIMKSGSSPQ